MPISNHNIPVGGTIATSGGTATPLASKGQSLTQHRLYLDDDSAFSEQVSFEFSISEPVQNKNTPNGYTQGRSTLRIMQPLNPTDGNRTINTIEVKLSVDPLTPDADVSSLLLAAASVMGSSEANGFWFDRALG